MPLLTVSIEQQLPSFAALTKYHVRLFKLIARSKPQPTRQ